MEDKNPHAEPQPIESRNARGRNIIQGSEIHVQAAMPILNRIIYITGLLSGLAIVGGIVGIIWNAFSPTEIDMFGAKVTTGHVGVDFTALGIIAMVFVVRAVLSNIIKLAALPEDEPRRKKRGTK